MEVRAPEAGLPLDKDLILVVALHETLVRNHGAKPIAMKFLLDSQRSDGVDGHYEAEYEIRGGRQLKLIFKRVRNDMVVKADKGAGQVSYSINIDRYVDEDLMPIRSQEYDDLVSHWVND